MTRYCTLPTCSKPLHIRSGEAKSTYLRRKYCDRKCVNKNLSILLSRPINHGTVSGYNTHLKRGESPAEICPECHKARLEWQRDRYPTLSSGAKIKLKARRRAASMLVAMHHDEYTAIVAREYAKITSTV